MKSLRNLFAALALTCVLSVSAMAGDMDTGYSNNGGTGNQVTVAGDMDTGKTASVTTGDMGTPVTSLTDPVTGIALSLLQNVLSLF